MIKLPENPYNKLDSTEYVPERRLLDCGDMNLVSAYDLGQQVTLKAVVEWLEEQPLEKAFPKDDRYYLVSQIKVDELKKLIV